MQDGISSAVPALSSSDSRRRIARPEFPVPDTHREGSELLKLEGVGRKISDCVLLFAFGHATAFPVDVWIMKALRQLYFPGRKVNLRQLQEFTGTHFGPHAGYAQQYLFHYARSQMKKQSTA